MAEFDRYTVPKHIGRTIVEEGEKKTYYKSYQKLSSLFGSINFPLERLVIKFDTGAGKTRTALRSAINHIENVHDVKPDAKVIICCFKKNIFRDELMGYSDYGFFNEEEVSEYLELKKNRSKSKQDMDLYKSISRRMKLRLSDKRFGGYFRFIGYKELVLSLFPSQDVPYSYESIQEGVSSGTLIPDKHFISEFDFAFVIADEFHVMYNSREFNHYGICFKYILDLFSKGEPVKGARGLVIYVPEGKNKVLLLSATPISKSSVEIVEFLNIVIPSANFCNKDFFDANKLKPDALNKIRDVVKGRVSYVRDLNLKNYPTKQFIGDSIPGIKYLKFIICKPSTEHKNILDHFIKLPIEASPLLDIIMPDVNGEYTLYENQTIMDTYFNKTHNGIRIVESSIGYLYKGISQYIHIISGKYTKLLEILKESPGQKIIYHNNIVGSGVCFISSLLSENGIIQHGVTPNKSTLCSICKITFDNHKNLEHDFKAMSYVVLHGELTDQVFNLNLDMFNNGECTICIGSSKIRESLNFKAVNDLFVCSFPDTIGDLLQLLGRSVRMFSHKGLPQNMQYVNIYILCGSEIELNRYREKMLDYEIIQSIEKIIHETAVDAKMNKQLVQKNLEDSINVIRFDSPESMNEIQTSYGITIDLSNDSSFLKYYMTDEVREQMELIKFCFSTISKVWTPSDLWEYIRSGDVYSEVNAKSFTYDSFIIAINTIISGINLPFNKSLSTELYIDGTQYKITCITGTQNESLILAIPSYSYKEEMGTNSSSKTYSIAVDSWYRNVGSSIRKFIPIDRFLSKGSDYETKRSLIINEIAFSSELEIYELINRFNIDFHIRLMREVIVYFFNTLIYTNIDLVEYHMSYVTLLAFYKVTGYIVFASDILDKYVMYKKYVEEVLEDPYIIVLRRMIDSLEEGIFGAKLNVVDSYTEKRAPKTGIKELSFEHNKNPIRVRADHLPVGYNLCQTGSYQYCLYDPKSNLWIEKFEPIFVDNTTTENNIVIGYHADNGFDRNFKIRMPIQGEIRDKRKIIKGRVCTTFDKNELKKIYDTITKKDTPLNTTKDLCKELLLTLVRLELKERKKKVHRTKWYYFSFEYNPLKH
jgi:hypothetical protein